MRELFGQPTSKVREMVKTVGGKRVVSVQNGMMTTVFEVVEETPDILVLRAGPKTITLFGDSYEARRCSYRQTGVAQQAA